MQPDRTDVPLVQNMMKLLAVMNRISLLALLAFASFANCAYALDEAIEGGAATDQSHVSYQKQIEPIFRVHCQGCHQPSKAQGGFTMLELKDLLAAGESGEHAVVPGKPDESYLIDQIVTVDGEAAMPKKAPPLSEEQVSLIRRWIEQGAKDDSPEQTISYSAESPPVYSRPPLISTLCYSPDGKWLASSGFHEVLLISTSDWKMQRRLVGLSDRIESLSFSPDSTRLAVTGGSPGKRGEIQVWSVSTGELLLSKQFGFDTIYGGCFSPDGSLIAFGCPDNTVRAIDSKTGEQRLHQGAHDDWILDCVFSPDGSHLVSAGRDMTVKLTEVATERFVDNITSITPGALSGGVSGLAMHPERNEVLVGGADGIPKVYRLHRETERRIGDDANLIRQFPGTGARIFAVDISRQGDLLAVASTLDGASKIIVYPYDFDGELSKEVKAAMGKRVAERSADEKKVIADYIHDISDAQAECGINDSSVYSLQFSPDGSQIACGGSDGAIRIIDAKTGDVVHTFAPVELQEASNESTQRLASLRPGSGMPVPDHLLPPPGHETGNRKVTRLEVSPHQFQLQSPTDYVQLVVTATLDDGSKIDVTRDVDISSANANVDVDAFGMVRATNTGQGELSIRYGGELTVSTYQIADAAGPLQYDFINDINPVLSKLGCNSGTCHGAQKGKNGFKLSLRGYDPVTDIRALSDDLRSRRLNSAAPDASVMLLKPIGAVPHEGGVLMSPDSAHYHLLRSWISDGAPLDLDSQKVSRIEVTPQKPVIDRENQWQQFRVVAHYPNGMTRDVTHEAFLESGNTEVCESAPGGRVKAIRRGEAPVLVRYEGAYAAATVTVMGSRENFVWEDAPANNTIDRLVSNKWQRMKILPSQLCPDNEFLRRVRLDLTGLPPSSEELKNFLADSRPSQLKRQAKVDELLDSEDYVEHWTNKWADLLQVNSKFIGKNGAQAFRDWIRESVSTNKPYDEFAREVLTATGTNRTNPAASYYKILRDPDLIMENTTHLFLAIRFNCNKCHDHPFERWTQDQYYELAAYFAQTGLKEDPESKGKKIGGTAVEGAKPLYEVVYDKAEGEIQHIRTAKDVAPQFPFDCEYEVSEDATRRERLAAWITSPDNPYFAKSMVNRLWGYLTGTGLMEPLDDIRAGNPPTNPELLTHLTDEFLQSEFDVKHVLRLICNSRTYQLSVASNEWNSDDTINYSHAKARRLPAEVLYDAVYSVTGAVSNIPGVEPGTRAAALPDVAVQLPDGFLNNLGRPVRESACECERSQGLQLGPVMALVSGPTIGTAISDPKCALPQLAADELTDEQLIREVYLRVLSREPTLPEVEGILAASEQIDIDHDQLESELASQEKWWADQRSKREKKRLADLAAVKTKIEQRKVEIQPERERMEKERLARLDAAKKKLAEFEKGQVDLAWTSLHEKYPENHWFPLAASKLTASNKDKLVAQQDRSIVATGNAGKGIYTLEFETPLRRITGIRLEALPHEGIPGGGPGLPPNGNFVVTELDVSAAALGSDAKPIKQTIAKGLADFSQSGFNPNQLFDGRERDQKGWAVHPRGGTVHWTVLQFDEPIVSEKGSHLVVRLHQFHNADKHRLAHFRISVTTDDGDLKTGLPEELTALKSLPKSSKNKESLQPLLAYLEKSDPDWLKHKQAVADANKPLAEDEQLVQMAARQKLLEQETQDDPALVQLRKDFDASKSQVSNRRLTLVQDLTWALINSPAFLFNH